MELFVIMILETLDKFVFIKSLKIFDVPNVKLELLVIIRLEILDA